MNTQYFYFDAEYCQEVRSDMTSTISKWISVLCPEKEDSTTGGPQKGKAGKDIVILGLTRMGNEYLSEL